MTVVPGVEKIYDMLEQYQVNGMFIAGYVAGLFTTFAIINVHREKVQNHVQRRSHHHRRSEGVGHEKQQNLSVAAPDAWSIGGVSHAYILRKLAVLG